VAAADSQRTRPVLEQLEARQLMTGDIAALSDEFDNPATLADWQRIHQVEGWNADQLAVYDIGATHPGRMTMVPHSSGWYADYRGELSFKEVTGDFTVTTLVHIDDRDDVGGSDADHIPSDSTFSLGGVMIRTPRDIASPADWVPGSGVDDGTNTGENFVFLSLGYGMGPAAMSLELKNTRNSNSNVQLLPLDGNPDSLELRIVRSGSTVTTMYRQPGAEMWQLAGSFSRPDMPETLQVGLVAYTDWDKMSGFDPFFQNGHVLSPATIPPAQDPNPSVPFNPDLEASFDYIRFESAAAPTNDGMRVGINLEPIADWSPGFPFRDAFLRALPWSTFAYNTVTLDANYQAAIAPGGPALQVDEHGWVAALPAFSIGGQQFQQVAGTRVLSPQSHNPAGTYTLEWDGTGSITLNSMLAPPIVPQGTTADGSHYAEIALPEGIELNLYITQTDPADPVRNIDFWMPDYNGVSFVGGNFDPSNPNSSSPFHPAYLERLAGLDTVRAIQWQAITSNQSVT
jgi:hypothetical protein